MKIDIEVNKTEVKTLTGDQESRNDTQQSKTARSQMSEAKLGNTQRFNMGLQKRLN